MKKWTFNHVWFFLFTIWFLLLSGILSGVVGSPGIIQLLRLKHMHSLKEKQAEDLRQTISQLEAERLRLEKNTVAQEQEVRRVLGYLAQDEIIFDFSASEQMR